jgi:hypothetical protein
MVTTQALAHPPSNIIITYDPQSRMLTATIKHNVQDPREHFIVKVAVRVNQSNTIEQKLPMQESLDSQVVAYRLPDIITGDTIAVAAYCSEFGQLEKSIVIGK